MGNNIKTGIVGGYLAFLILGASQVQGADVTWDGSENNQWNQNKNWSSGAAPGTSDTAVFANPVTANQATVNKAASVLGVAFTGTGGWTVGAGNTLTVGANGIDQTGSGLNTVAATVALNGASTWTVNSGTLVVSGVVSGASGLTKNGAGTLSQSGANTYTGATTISAGTLSANTLANGGANSSIGASGTAAANLVFNGGTLRYTGAAVTTNRLFTLTENGGTIEANGSGAVNFGNAAAIAFSGNGARTLTLTGISTGTNTITSIVGDGSGGATSLVKNGAGTWRLAGANTYSGGTTINEGTLQVTAADRLSTSGNITVNGGTLDLGGSGQTTSGNVTIAGGTVSNGTLTKVGGNFSAQSGSVGSSTVLAGTGVGFQKTTGSLFTLNGNHTYTGATVVSGGKLIVNGSIVSSGGVEVASGATLGGHGGVCQISGAGTVAPGESPGILTADSVNGSAGLDFHFEFTNAAVLGISVPDFLDSADSGNDLLRLTGGTPFTTALTLMNTVTVDFSQVTLNMGDRYLGGFYTLIDASSDISGADFDYIGLGEYGVMVSMVQWTADFGGGPVNGYITQFEVIPEPNMVALLTLSGIGSLVMYRKRKRMNFHQS